MQKLIALLVTLFALAFAPLAHAQYVPPAGGQWKLLSTNTISAPVSTVEFTSSVTGNYKEFYLVVNNVYCDSTNTFVFQWGSNASYVSGAGNAATCPDTGAGVIGAFYIPKNNDRGIVISGFVRDNGSPSYAYVSEWANANQIVQIYRLPGVVNYFKITTGNNMISGTVYLYGR